MSSQTDARRSFWTLSGSPTLLRHPALHSLARKYSLTPEQTVYKICQLYVLPRSPRTSNDDDQVEHYAALRIQDIRTRRSGSGSRERQQIDKEHTRGEAADRSDAGASMTCTSC